MYGAQPIMPRLAPCKQVVYGLCCHPTTRGDGRPRATLTHRLLFVGRPFAYAS